MNDPFFTLTVSLHAFQANFRFCFLSKANADAAYAALKRPFNTGLNLEPIASDHDDVEISDDYGNSAVVDRNLIMTMVLTDAHRNANADVMASYITQKQQIHLNKKMLADPEVKAAQAIVQARMGGHPGLQS